MFAPFISALVASIAIVNMSSSYMAKTTQEVLNADSNNLAKFLAQEKILLDGTEFYCQSNPEKCVSTTSTIVELDKNEVLKYTPLDNIKPFMIGSVDRIKVDRDNSKIILEHTFVNDEAKSRFENANTNKLYNSDITGTELLKPISLVLNEKINTELESQETFDINTCLKKCRDNLCIKTCMNKQRSLFIKNI